MASPRKKADTSHLIIGTSGLERGDFGCLNCGSTHRVAYPIAFEMLTATMDAFTKLHKKCKPEANPLRQKMDDAMALRPTTPQEWIEGPDTGLSSITLWTVLDHRYFPDGKTPTRPMDNADFGRCYRLVKRIPGWEARLSEVSKRYPEWQPIVDNWAALCAAYEADKLPGHEPMLYPYMKSLGL